MKYKTFLVFCFILFLVPSYSLWGQFTSEEIARRPQLEKLLKTAEILKSEKIGEGVTDPWKIFLKCEEGETYGCWKNPKGMQKGHLEGWQYEIAAYEMDKLLGLNMIPPTVARKFKGKDGSLQFWVEKQYSLLDIMSQGIEIPNEYKAHTNKMKYITRAFDSLIANEDRTQQNILYTKDWRVILIDHSRSFRSSKKYKKNLMFGKNGIQGQKLIRILPRNFVEKIKALDFESAAMAVGPYLEKKEIEAILKRKELLLSEIEEMIKEKGESQVLY